MFCPRCGKNNNRVGKYCEFCGKETNFPPNEYTKRGTIQTTGFMNANEFSSDFGKTTKANINKPAAASAPSKKISSSAPKRKKQSHKKIAGIFAFVLAIAIIGGAMLTFFNSSSSVNKENPTKAVSAFLRNYVKKDYDEIRKYILTTNTAYLNSKYKQYFDDIDLSSNSFDFLSDFYDNELVLAIASKLKYTIKEESVKNDTATVTVLIETPNMKEIIQKLMSDDRILTLNESEITSMFLEEILKSNLSKNEIQFNLELKDDKWLIALDRFDIMDALSGGLLSEYQNMYQETLEEFKQKIEEAEFQ